MMMKLDPHYNRRLVEFMSKNPLEPGANLGYVLRYLEKAQYVASYFRIAIYAALYFEVRPGGRSRPSLP
jgi:hypothetical protein